MLSDHKPNLTPGPFSPLNSVTNSHRKFVATFNFISLLMTDIYSLFLRSLKASPLVENFPLVTLWEKEPREKKNKICLKEGLNFGLT